GQEPVGDVEADEACRTSHEYSHRLYLGGGSPGRGIIVARGSGASLIGRWRRKVYTYPSRGPRDPATDSRDSRDRASQRRWPRVACRSADGGYRGALPDGPRRRCYGPVRGRHVLVGRGARGSTGADPWSWSGGP